MLQVLSLMFQVLLLVNNYVSFVNTYVSFGHELSWSHVKFFFETF
jgi:hypothetical protein